MSKTYDEAISYDYCFRCGGDLPHPIYHQRQPVLVEGKGMLCPDCEDELIEELTER